MNEQYTFFWNGPFSQWFPSKFKVGEQEFNCAEQFMMYSKAIFFDDKKIADQIMQSTSPRDQKKMGRQVKNFDESNWNQVAKSFVYVGNMAKFSQNPNLLEILMKTGDTILVEASPYDRIWGIGLDEVEAKTLPPEQWRGTNFLGLVLTQVKNDIKNYTNDPLTFLSKDSIITG